ncbi:MAG: GAF domain-containing protein, partial [Thermodesulfobacteriota bacterium]
YKAKKEVAERKQAEEALNESLVQISKKNRYETIIRRVIESVHQSINLQEVLEHAVDAMNKNIEGAESIFISMVEGEEADPILRHAVLKAYRGYPDWFIERIRRIPYPKGATWKTIIEGKPLYCPDAEKDTVIGPAGKEIGTKSYACMPIRFGDETVGCMSINSLEKDAFDDEELKLLEIVAKQIEIAVNNAKQADALRTQKEKLELRVQERTKELAEMNVELRKEIDWRMRIEKALRKRTEKIIQHHKVLLEIARMDNSDLDSVLRRITEVDAETLSTERVSVWFFNEDCSALICKDLYKASARNHESGLRFRVKDHPIYFQALEESRILGSNDACTDSRTSEFAEGYLKPLGITSMMDVPIRVHGTVVGVVCHEHVGVMREWTGEEQDFVASIADMISLAIEASERRRVEDQVRASLAEKEILLKEIHHRVKNNLQVICSLLNLQSSYIDDAQTRERLKESQDRVKAMALIHETLYRSKDLARVDLGEYIKRLSALLLRSYMVSSKQIRMEIDVDNVLMSVDKAIPCGLIINEIVSNSIKHAFPVKRKGRVGISLSSVNSIRAESG